MKKVFRKLYIFLLIGFTAYTLLDTFLLTDSITKVETAPAESSEINLDEVTLTELADGSKLYFDGNITIKLSNIRYEETDVHLADITLRDPSYLKTAFAKDTYGRHITEAPTSQAERHNAIIAINGDYYGARERGYVIRNGVLYQNTSAKRKNLVIYSDGSCGITEEGKVSAEQLISDGAIQTFTFGPVLYNNGEICVGENDEVSIASPSNPRTASIYIDKGHYMFLVSDGRTKANKGLSLYQLADFCKGIGAQIAYNLDGGGSSCMVFMDEVINFPTNSGSYYERSVSDIVYIGY